MGVVIKINGEEAGFQPMDKVEIIDFKVRGKGGTTIEDRIFSKEAQSLMNVELNIITQTCSKCGGMLVKFKECPKCD